jgi:hypothetical protein
MIDAHCPHCGRVLVGPRQIVSMRSDDAGIEVAYVCWCGRLGAEVSGRRAGGAPAVGSAAGSTPAPSGVRR